MAVLHSLTILSLLLLFHLSSASRYHKTSLLERTFVDPSLQQTSNIIHETCKASREPSACEAWLSDSKGVPFNATVLQVIQSALGLTSKNLDKGQAMVQDILKSSAGNVNRSGASNNCLDFIRCSKYRISLVDEALTRGGVRDARAWLSAALMYQYDCWSALKYVNDTAQVVQTMKFFNSSLIAGSSSALGMLLSYDVFGEKTASWGPPRTERDGFWEPVSNSTDSVGGVPSGLKEDITVCKDGAGCKYTTVQEAVNAAPDNAGPGKRFVIRIKAGVYEETVRVPLEKKNVVFFGDGMGKTVITGSRNVGQAGMTTYESATVGVAGDAFMATGITFQNTAGPDAHQAVAFRSDSDQSVIENCEFLGNQDTLYAHTLRQYYKSCRIQGNVDFIFGNSAAFFQDCLILLAPRQNNPEKGESNAVTAHGRIDPGQSTGFVFQDSVINGTEAYMALYRKNPKVHKNFLGRPWKEFSRTVFIECTLEALIAPDGWMPWDGDFALKTLYYGEFRNRGAGSNVERRVPWSSQIPADHAASYSVQNFVQGDQWIPKSLDTDCDLS